MAFNPAAFIGPEGGSPRSIDSSRANVETISSDPGEPHEKNRNTSRESRSRKLRRNLGIATALAIGSGLATSIVGISARPSEKELVELNPDHREPAATAPAVPGPQESQSPTPEIEVAPKKPLEPVFAQVLERYKTISSDTTEFPQIGAETTNISDVVKKLSFKISWAVEHRRNDVLKDVFATTVSGKPAAASLYNHYSQIMDTEENMPPTTFAAHWAMKEGAEIESRQNADGEVLLVPIEGVQTIIDDKTGTRNIVFYAFKAGYQLALDEAGNKKWHITSVQFPGDQTAAEAFANAQTFVGEPLEKSN